MNAACREIPAKLTFMVCAMAMDVQDKDGEPIGLRPGDFILERDDGAQFGIAYEDFVAAYRPSSSTGRDIVRHAESLLK